MWDAYFCMGAYKHDVVVVTKNGCLYSWGAYFVCMGAYYPNFTVVASTPVPCRYIIDHRQSRFLFLHIESFINVAFHCSGLNLRAPLVYTTCITLWFYQFTLYSEEEVPDIEVGMHGNSYSLL